MDFSVILQDAKTRAYVQSGILERAFHDALYPMPLFRDEALPKKWPGNYDGGGGGVGDSMVFTAPGLMPTAMAPITPGSDATPGSYSVEQWAATLQQYGAGAPDTHAPTSLVAIANLLYRNAQQLGLQATQSLNRKVRNRLYNAALSGNTVVDGGSQTGTTLRVMRLNGFTTARRPGVSGASQVQFLPVSATNPLPITVDGATPEANTVVDFTPDTAGDEFGPGTLTLGTTITGAAADRNAVLSFDRTPIFRSGSSPTDSVDDLGSTDTLTFEDCRSALSRLMTANVPYFADRRYHAHLDPQVISELYSLAEFQRINAALPDFYHWKNFTIGEFLGTLFVRNTEAPQKSAFGTTVQTTNDDGVTFDPALDDFAGELFNTGLATGLPVHRSLFLGQGAIWEMWLDLSAGLLTEAGLNGRVGAARIINNGIEVFADRIAMILRGPIDRLQQMVSTSWSFIGDWPVRTDAATGDASRYKRVVVVESV